jgi:hypothetical protein
MNPTPLMLGAIQCLVLAILHLFSAPDRTTSSIWAAASIVLIHMAISARDTKPARPTSPEWNLFRADPSQPNRKARTPRDKQDCWVLLADGTVLEARWHRQEGFRTLNADGYTTKGVQDVIEWSAIN